MNDRTTDSKGTRMRRRFAYPRSPIPYPLAGAILALALVACSPKGEALYNRAETALANGETRAAVIDLKNLVQDEPQNAKARAMLGRALLESGDLQGGEIELQKARDLGISPEMILLADCRLKLAKGEFDTVLADCQPGSAPEQDRAQLHVVQGFALLNLKRAAEAKPEFEAALAAEPGDLDALLGLASAAFATDGRQAVKPVLDRAPEELKQRSQYWMAVGGLDMGAGDFAAAEQSFQKALDRAEASKRGRERVSALAALAEAQMRQAKLDDARATTAQLSKAAPKNLQVKQLTAQVEAAAGNLDEARSLLEEVVSKQPGNYQAKILLGMVNLQQGNLGQAEVQFAEVVAERPNNVQAQKLLADARGRMQTPAATLANLKASLDPATADAEMLAMAGRLSLEAGDQKQALSYYAQAAAQLGPDAPPATQVEIAGGFMRAGEFDRAIEILEGVPAGVVGGYQREYLLMLALLRKGEKDLAMAEADALVKRSGDDPAARNLAAAVQAAAGDPDAGRAQFEEALKLKPDDPATLLNLARLEVLEGKPDEAEKLFQQALKTDPKNLAAMQGLASIAVGRKDAAGAERWLRKATTELPDSVAARLVLAQFYLSRKELDMANEAVDAAAKIAPDNDAVANARGTLQISAGDVPGAIASFTRAVELAPKAYWYRLNLARAYIWNRDVNAAMGVLDDLLSEAPEYQPALVLAASSSMQTGQLEKAAGYVERLRRLAPDAPTTYRAEGDLAMRQQRYKEALDYYRKAGARGKDSGLVASEYGAAVRAGAVSPERVLEDWVAEHPEDSSAVALLAGAYERGGDVEAAVSLYERSLAAAPGNALTLNNLAVLYQRNGDPRMLETAKKAYEAAPQSAAIQDTYGWILFGEGEVDKAVEILAEAAKGLPQNSEVQYHYAAALAKKGDTAAASEAIRKVNLEQVPEAQRADAKKLRDELVK